MTPEQVRELPNNRVILLAEGLRPIYDMKNRPFHTAVWKEAEQLAGKHGYTHPIRVVHDEENDVYKTIDCEKKIMMIDKDEEQFYRNAEKTDKRIHIFDIDEEEFLYLNWDEPEQPTIGELQKMVQESQKNDVSKMGIPEDAKGDTTQAEKPDPAEKSQAVWDLSGSIIDCVKRYADQLTEEEMNVIIQSMEDGVADEDIKKYFALHDAAKMERYHRAFQFTKGKK